MKNLSLEEHIVQAGKIKFKDIPVRIRTPKTRERFIKKLHLIFPYKERIIMPQTKYIICEVLNEG